MINIRNVKSYCKDFRNIENFKEAYEDLNETWHCHHKLEIHSDYENSAEDLVLMNLYYDRPAEELIFLKAADHFSLHRKGKKPKNWENLIISNKGKKRSVESKDKMRKSAHISYDKGGHRGGAKFKGMKWKVINGKRVWYV